MDVMSALLIAWGLASALLFILWCIQVKTNNASYVDVGWTISIVLTAVVLAIMLKGNALRDVLCLGMIGLWGGRLSVHLVKRIKHEAHEDKRYQRMRQDWGGNLNQKFFFFFQFQAVLAVLLAVVFIAPMRNTTSAITIVEVLAVIIWIIGFWGESIADHQLKQFKANSANRGKTCDIGLWYCSRHPNYFFEWLMWVAYFIFALGSVGGVWGIASPVIMLILLLKVSGVPLAEAQALLSKGDNYRRYQESTSMFIPWFKKG